MAPSRPHQVWFGNAPAKINLSLEICDQTPDGYHELETVIVPVGLSDRLALAVPLADPLADPLAVPLAVPLTAHAASPDERREASFVPSTRLSYHHLTTTPSTIRHRGPVPSRHRGPSGATTSYTPSFSPSASPTGHAAPAESAAAPPKLAAGETGLQPRLSKVTAAGVEQGPITLEVVPISPCDQTNPHNRDPFADSPLVDASHHANHFEKSTERDADDNLTVSQKGSVGSDEQLFADHFFDRSGSTTAAVAASPHPFLAENRLTRGQSFSPYQRMPSIPTDAENLVVRALRQLQRASGTQLGAHVRLVKRIPSQAGLGGGSSDAATALLLANHAWNLGWSAIDLARIAETIGSDVPFFIHNGAAICTGRGERVTPIGPIPRWGCVIAKPPAGLDTGKVFRQFSSQNRSTNQQRTYMKPGRVVRVVNSLREGNLTELSEAMGNDLEQSAARLSPWIDWCRHQFSNLGFAAHQLTGSGTAYFGICRSVGDAVKLASILRARLRCQVFATTLGP